MKKIWKLLVAPVLQFLFPVNGLGWILLETIILVCMASVFVHKLTIRPLWTDELLTFYQVHHLGVSGFLKSMDTGVNVMPFTTFFPYLLLDYLCGLDAFTLRLPSLLCSAGVLLLFLLLFRKYAKDGWIHLLTLVFLAWNPSFTYYASEARSYQLLLLFVLVSVGIGFSCFSRQRSARFLFLAGVFIILLPLWVHYLGLFYGAIVLLSVVGLMGLRSRWKEVLMLVSGGALGGVISGLLFGKHMLMAVRSEGLISAYLETPSIGELFRLGIFQPKIPGIWILWGLLGCVFSMRSFLVVSLKRNGIDPDHDGVALRFLMISGFGFLLLPNLLCVLAVIGLPNLCLDRYFYPGILAMPMIFLAVIALIRNRFEWGCDLLEFWGDWTKLGCVFFVGLFAVTTVSQLRKLPTEVDQEYRAIVETSTVTPVIVTPHLHLFFELAYRRSDQIQVYWLRETRREADMVSIFNPELKSVDPETLGVFPQFVFINREPASINSFPDFDLQKWAIENDRKVTQIGNHRWSVSRLMENGDPEMK